MRPYDSKLELSLYIIVEGLLVVVFCMFMVLATRFNDLPIDDSSKIELGWALISFCIIIIVVL